MPRDGNAGALMHERLAFDRRAKNVEPEETPRVGGLRRPDAKNEPAKFPEQTQRPVAARPGRFLRRALLRLYRCFWFHRKSEGKCSKAERQPQMDTDVHGCRTFSKESVARSISNRRKKQFFAFSFIAIRTWGSVATQRLSKAVVPARSSFST